MITFHELLQLLRLDREALNRYIRTGKFPPPDVNLGYKTRLWRRERVDAWLAEQAEAAHAV